MKTAGIIGLTLLMVGLISIPVVIIIYQNKQLKQVAVVPPAQNTVSDGYSHPDKNGVNTEVLAWYYALPNY